MKRYSLNMLIFILTFHFQHVTQDTTLNKTNKNPLKTGFYSALLTSNIRNLCIFVPS